MQIDCPHTSISIPTKKTKEPTQTGVKARLSISAPPNKTSAWYHIQLNYLNNFRVTPSYKEGIKLIFLILMKKKMWKRVENFHNESLLFLCTVPPNFSWKNLGKRKKKKKLVYKVKKMRKPGIEPGAQRWQRWILPLNHLR